MKQVTNLVSTMKSTNGLLIKMNIKDFIVVNQTDTNSVEILENSNIWINSETIGLSKSRNIAVQNSNADISVISDDDMTYCNDYQQLIYDSYKNNPTYDILVFQVNSHEGFFKKYSSKPFDINYLSSMKVSSVQITFRTDAVKDKIIFDELFGSGSTFSMGEENIFLFDCLRNGLKIKYIPLEIAKLKTGDSTWFKGFNKKYLIDRGASYYRMSQIYYPLLILQFGLRKNRLFRSEGIGIYTSIKTMFLGVKNYKDIIRQGD